MPKETIWSVATQQNSLAQAIAQALELRLAIDAMLSLSKYGKGKNDLHRFKLTVAEWQLLEQMLQILQVWLTAVAAVSGMLILCYTGISEGNQESLEVGNTFIA